MKENFISIHESVEEHDYFDDIYHEETRELLLDDDELTSSEDAFLRGFEDSLEDINHDDHKGDD